MSVIGELLLANLLAYLINLASNERSASISAYRERNIRKALEGDEALQRAIASARPIRDEIRATCIELARDRMAWGVTPLEEPVWRLLSEDSFQEDLAEWLKAGGIIEGNDAKHRLLSAMERALLDAGTRTEHIDFLKTNYFNTLEKSVFAHPILAHWRHQLSLEYLREQVAVLRQRAEEAAGVYTAKKQEAALDRYCEKALAAWDIIDLSNLPEGDIQMATQKLLLRQLYMPLRIEVEPTRPGEGDDAALVRMEEQREARRHREAGHLVADEPRPGGQKSRSPVGKCLEACKRLVVLGDPGGGKTTMLRWMATAFLLRQKGDSEFSQIPDTQTLPTRHWIPVLIRCRDLGETDLCRCFTDFLAQHLYKTELRPEEADVMRAVILDRIAKGEALLLVDGLDEITNPRVRTMFCQEVERTAARYPDAPIVITSRIVGYRDMPHRMGSGFVHAQIAELSRKDKDLFAQRWINVTDQHQPPDEKIKRARELLEALHSNDRIERLTGNPMLLTTLALVKRKVGKLPNKRNKLYAEAVSVLLNWNPKLYATIEEDEAIPQLEYLAYEMCRRGTQQLTEDEILDLLDKLRVEYPNIRAARRRDAHAFLALLEARSSILIKSGGAWQKNGVNEQAVWEFRHLTFQEYLAARALLDGRYPGRDKTKALAAQVSPLAGALERPKRISQLAGKEAELEVDESWREALRLLVADCKDDDVDEVLLAILNPRPEEQPGTTGRPRAVLATLCVADEPNIGAETANTVLQRLSNHVSTLDRRGPGETTLEAAAKEVGRSIWAPALKKALMAEYASREEGSSWLVGGLWGWVELASCPISEQENKQWFKSVIQRLNSSDIGDAASAALVVMRATYEGRIVIMDGMTGALLELLRGDRICVRAAAWALGWLSHKIPNNRRGSAYWKPDLQAVNELLSTITALAPEELNTIRWLCVALGHSGDERALPVLVSFLNHSNASLRRTVVEGLGHLGRKEALAGVLARLGDEDVTVRRAVTEVLPAFNDKEVVPALIASLDDRDPGIRLQIVRRLGEFGDSQAVHALITRLEGPEPNFRRAVIEALAKLGDKRAVAPLLAHLGSWDAETVATAAVALHNFGEPDGRAVLNQFLASSDIRRREIALRAYAQQMSASDKLLLSRDLDGANPWLDPQKIITRNQIVKAARRLELTEDQVRSRYEAMAADLGLKLSWKR